MSELWKWHRIDVMATARRWGTVVFLAILMLAVGGAQAATRAWLDRSDVVMDQTVVLNIETDQSGGVVPDYTPLRQDFEISNPFTSQSYENINGRGRTRTTFGMALRPLSEGDLTIPPLAVGRESTEALTLRVSPTTAAASSGAGDQVILETEVDDANPYVQQTVGVVVRLNLAVNIASGHLELPAPAGAILQQVGDDVQSARMINGRRYLSIERRFLLIPESSGTLTLSAPRFEGQSQQLYNSWDFSGSNDVQGRGRPTTLQVRPLPAQAPQPWLPLHDLKLRYAQAPDQHATVGEPLTLEVEMVAKGATRTQFSDWPKLEIPGAEVFPEPIAYADSFVDGSPQLRMTRRYSVIPDVAGTLAIPGMQVAWWDAGRGEARTTRLPDLRITVAGGSGMSIPSGNTSAAAAAVDSDDTTPPNAPVAASTGLPLSGASSAASDAIWRILAIVMAGLWLLTMGVWWWQLRKKGHVQEGQGPGRSAQASAAPVRTQAELKRVLDVGDLDEVGEVLRRMHAPALPDLDTLEMALADPAQRKVIGQLRRACWGNGDAPAARNALREAFRNGPQWAAETKPAGIIPSLPPLYPPH